MSPDHSERLFEPRANSVFSECKDRLQDGLGNAIDCVRGAVDAVLTTSPEPHGFGMGGPFGALPGLSLSSVGAVVAHKVGRWVGGHIQRGTPLGQVADNAGNVVCTESALSYKTVGSSAFLDNRLKLCLDFA